MSLTSTIRRYKLADRKFRRATVTMRPYKNCRGRGTTCKVTRQQPKCEEYFRHNRKCELAGDYEGIDKAIREAEKLDNEILQSRMKTARLEKQRRFQLKRLKELGDKESANILEIEEQEQEEGIQAEDPILNDFSFDVSLDQIQLPDGWENILPGSSSRSVIESRGN